MLEVELRVPGGVTAVPEVVERMCALDGLTLTLKGALVKYPGSVHWHFKKGKQPGTLELTWWPPQKRLWFKVAQGRRATWIDETLAGLQVKIEQALSGLE